jgi:hypothetical protein
MPGSNAERAPELQGLSEASILRRADRTAWQTFDDRVVVLDIPARTMLGLNPTAAEAWQALDGKRDLQSIAREIADKHGQPSAQVCRDVIAFMRTLLDRACVDPVPQDPSALAQSRAV